MRILNSFFKTEIGVKDLDASRESFTPTTSPDRLKVGLPSTKPADEISVLILTKYFTVDVPVPDSFISKDTTLPTETELFVSPPKLVSVCPSFGSLSPNIAGTKVYGFFSG